MDDQKLSQAVGALKFRLPDTVKMVNEVRDKRRLDNLVKSLLTSSDSFKEKRAELKRTLEANGIAVKPKELKGIVEKAYRDKVLDQFSYQKPTGLKYSLAKASLHWKPATAILGAVVIAGVASLSAYQVIKYQRNAEFRELSSRVETLYTSANNAAKTENAKGKASELFLQAKQYISVNDLSNLKHASKELEKLNSTLVKSYELIAYGLISRRFRDEHGNVSSDRKRYVSLVAFDQGKLSEKPHYELIYGSENKRSREVCSWSVQVNESTWHRIMSDKGRDGVIDANPLAIKLRGHLEAIYHPKYELLGSTIFETSSKGKPGVCR